MDTTTVIHKSMSLKYDPSSELQVNPQNEVQIVQEGGMRIAVPHTIRESGTFRRPTHNPLIRNISPPHTQSANPGS